MKKNTSGADESKRDASRDEHAYEDSWYRSLKALAEYRASESPEEANEPAEHQARVDDREPPAAGCLHRDERSGG